MKIAVIGLPNVGKRTLFALMTGVSLEHLHEKQADFVVGVMKVPDPRVEKLAEMYKPERVKHAEIECTLAPPPPKEPKARDAWLEKLKLMDALCHVVRAFDDPSVFHIAGSVDPMRDIETMNLELAVSDLSLVEKRLERIAAEQKKKHDPEREFEQHMLEKFKTHLESGSPLRALEMGERERRLAKPLQFLTMKSMVIALNVGENLMKERALLEKLPKNSMQLCAKLEEEIAEIENPAERAEFLSALGIEEPAVHALARLCYREMGLISFFTVGKDEVRAWTIRHGATALEAAGAIHTDLARGFIRAEVMKFDDLVAAGDEHRLKEQGKLMLKGKEYVVEDGEIVHIRHSG
jgi:GTP-binding protein YchF